jgi:hypothetical protein
MIAAGSGSTLGDIIYPPQVLPPTATSATVTATIRREQTWVWCCLVALLLVAATDMGATGHLATKLAGNTFPGSTFDMGATGIASKVKLYE